MPEVIYSIAIVTALGLGGAVTISATSAAAKHLRSRRDFKAKD